MSANSRKFAPGLAELDFRIGMASFDPDEALLVSKRLFVGMFPFIGFDDLVALCHDGLV
jgi:hypothetical protein